MVERRSKFPCSIVQNGGYSLLKCTVCFKVAGREYFGCSHYEEIINVEGDSYANYPNLIIVRHLHVPEHHVVPHEYLQLCVNQK